MKLNVYGEMAHARALAEHSGLTIVYERDTTMPRTDGKTVFLPEPKADWSDDAWTLWRAWLYHEVGHNVPEMKPAMDYVAENGLNTETPFGFCLNVLEDYRQEKFGYEEYEGKKQIMSRGRELFAKSQRDNPLWEAPSDQMKDILRSLFLFDMHCREDWMPSIAPHTRYMATICNKESIFYLRKLIDGNYRDKLNAVVTFSDELKLARDILKNVYDLNPDEEEAKSKNPQNSEQDNEFNEKSTSSNSKGNGNGTEDGQEEDGESSDSEIDWTELLMHDHNPENYKKDRTSTAKQHINYDKIMSGKWVPYPDNLVCVVDYHKGTCTHDHWKYLLDESDAYKGIKDVCHGDSLSKKVLRLLQIHSKDRYKYGKKKGRLHSKNLYRGAMTEATGFNKKVFKKRESNDCLDVCVTVLGDCSGSMGGTKFSNMGKSMILLSRVLSDIKIRHELVGFTDGMELIQYLYKPFSSGRLQSEALADRIQSSSRYMGCNADADSVMWVFSRIRKEKVKRKIIIVLSDGCPAGGYRGNYESQPTALTNVVKAIKTSGVEIYGIGIEDDNVKIFYPESQVINDSDELENALLSLIKRKIIG